MSTTDAPDKPFMMGAYKAAKSNGGAAGVDRQTIEALEANLGKNLYRIWNRMSSGSDFAPLVRDAPFRKEVVEPAPTEV
ncbi:hypothetical protein [Mesorhizobium sp. M6A.T.Cr.TU.017.01.1.1]|uniref:hypothetical protein n=1 Tax=Mesorhizobium sp. M6A.T.Cr.TU.017.01.1.1 TaxID=2496774 RepID=UPI0019D4143A|nr:hypothetical protein [Mesorhizobium sp. M6A.T.Cr.TU.017.01.1.1]